MKNLSSFLKRFGNRVPSYVPCRIEHGGFLNERNKEREGGSEGNLIG